MKDGVRVYKDRNGKVVKAENGFYDPSDRSIHIDLNAGSFGRGTVLFTISHEFVHFMKDTSPQHFEKLADLLVKGYAKQGQSVDDLIALQQAEAEENGRSLTHEEAFEEVVADSMEEILADGRVMELMQMLEAEDHSFAGKVKKFFQDIMQLLKETIRVYSSFAPDSREGNMVREMRDIYAQLQEIFAEGIYEGGKNHGKMGAKENTTGEGGVKYQAKPSVTDPRVLDPRTVTKTDVVEMLKNVKAHKYAEKTYIPVRISTPGIVQERLFAKNNPIIMPVSKLSQVFAQDKGAIKGKNVRGHGFSVDQLIAIIEQMDSPDYIYSQDNGRGVEVIKMVNFPENTVVIVEFDNNVNPAYMNGYEGGAYNVSVTMFNVDGGNVGLFMYKQDKGWNEVFNKQKEGDPAKKFPATRPFAVEQGSLGNSVLRKDEVVNKKVDNQGGEKANNIADVRSTKEPNIKPSTRKGETTSYTTRSLLMNADESIAIKPIQQKALKQYREIIEKLQLEEKQLEDAQQQLEAIQDRKGQEAKRQQLELRRQILAIKDRMSKLREEQRQYEGYEAIKDMVRRERKRVVQEQLTDYREKYGTIKAGEKKVRDDSLPVSTDGKNKVSRTARTVKGAAATTDEFAELIDDR